MKILIVEDEPKIASMIQVLMEDEGYDCLLAADGHRGLESFRFHRPDLVILDWNLPGMNGIDVCTRIRQSNVADPFILMLTARQSPEDRLDGFTSGADDYMSKPFGAKELTVRVRALMRRQLRQAEGEVPSSIIETPHLRLNTETLTVYIRATADGELIPIQESLNKLLFNLLTTLARRPGRIWSRDELLSAVWEDDFNGSDRIVDASITRLRARLKASATDRSDKFIKTKIGLGYFFEDAPNA